MTEIIPYRGYELRIDPQGTGFKVTIQDAGGGFVRTAIDHDPDKNRRDELVAEAKVTVDALLDPPHVKKDPA